MRLIVPRNRDGTRKTGIVDMDFVRAFGTQAYKRKIYWFDHLKTGQVTPW